ncbi:MAG: acyl-CoA dehydrogenase family protein [Polyangiaceae bacterium]|nr:acyl-CoA dehydrogenase family protein [Polyangiaceae bacterium]
MTTGTGIDKESLDLLLGSLRDFAKSRLPDAVLLELDAKDEFPEALVRELGQGLGIQLLFIEEAYGGMGGGAFDVYRVCEAMGRIDVGIATGVLATFLGSDPICFGGTTEQKARWLGRIASEGLLAAYGATEPQAGSDLAALRSTAERVEDHGAVVAYKLNGNKQWISNGGFADLYTFLANAPGGPSWFVLERGEKGLSWGEHEDKHGIRLSNTATVTCDDVVVPVDRLVGGVEGQGLVQAQLVFGYTRLMVAAFGLGAGWAALERAVRYSEERIQKGGPLSEKQGYTHKLIVPHAVALEAGRAYIEETAERIDRGDGSLNTEGAIAKYLATEAGCHAADAAIQALGGYGYTREYMVEKIKRDVRITRIYEGTSEIMEMTIARDRWQDHLKTRGRHYHDVAATLEALGQSVPEVGALEAARACHALAEVMERMRVARLTRHQHLLFRLGELVALAEGAGCLARRAARARRGELADKADRTFDVGALAAVSRVFARQAALRVAGEGLAWVRGAGGVADGELQAFQAALGLPEIHAAQAGLLADLDAVADALYGRSGKKGQEA